MELEESTEETARREVYEETGLRIGKLNLEEVVSGVNNYVKVSNGDEFYGVTIVYSTDDISGKIMVDKNESLAVSYFRFDDLPDKIVGSHKEMIARYIASNYDGDNCVN